MRLCVLIVLTHWGIISLFWGGLVLNRKKAKDEKVTFETTGSAMFQSWTWLEGSAGESLAAEVPSTLIR